MAEPTTNNTTGNTTGVKKTEKTAATSKRKSDRKPMSRGTRQGTESVLYLVVTLVAIIAANVFAYYFPVRIDTTQNHRYSLSDGSKNLVSHLDDSMEITAYFTSNLPQPFNTTERYVRNLLDEYVAASGGHIRAHFIDPDEDDEREQAQADGVREVQHQAIENDSVSVKTGYRGLVIRYLGDKQVLPVIQDTEGLEYEITQAIRQLVRDATPIGVMSGHGSPTSAEGLSTLRAALPSYELREVNVAEEIPHEIHALLIVNPTETINETELRRIDQFVMRGGSLGVFGGGINVSLEGMAPSGTAVDTGINRLLGAWGVTIPSSLVADARCGRVPLRTPMGIAIPVAYPPAPIVVFDDEQQENPAVFRLPQVPFFFTSPLTIDRAKFRANGGVVLGRSSEMSWLLNGPTIELQPRDPREWQPQQSGPYSVLVAFTHVLPSAFAAAAMSGSAPEQPSPIEAPERSTQPVRVLVAGSGALLRDEFLPSAEQAQGQMTGGLAFALNAVDWLASDPDLIAIRAKNIEDPVLDVPVDVRAAEQEIQQELETAAQQAEETGDRSGLEATVEAARDRHREVMDAWEAKKWLYRALAFAAMPLLVVVAGVVRWRSRMNKRASLREPAKPLTAKRAS